jgi:hypothetical protein
MDFNNYTKAPRADEPSLDLTERLRKATLNSAISLNLETKFAKAPKSCISPSFHIKQQGLNENSSSVLAIPSSVLGKNARQKLFWADDQHLARISGLDYKKSRTNLKISKKHQPQGKLSLESASQRSSYEKQNADTPGLSRVDERTTLRMSQMDDKSPRSKSTHTVIIPPSVRYSKSYAPSHAKSTLRSAYDIKMASRQTRIKTLAPEDRRKQEKWAQDQIKVTGACPENFLWIRNDTGYECAGGSHHIPDELLAEGRGGIMIGPCIDPVGPYYMNPKDGLWHYGGPKPVPFGVMEFYKPPPHGARKRNSPCLGLASRAPLQLPPTQLSGRQRSAYSQLFRG